MAEEKIYCMYCVRWKGNLSENAGCYIPWHKDPNTPVGIARGEVHPINELNKKNDCKYYVRISDVALLWRNLRYGVPLKAPLEEEVEKI